MGGTRSPTQVRALTDGIEVSLTVPHLPGIQDRPLNENWQVGVLHEEIRGQRIFHGRLGTAIRSRYIGQIHIQVCRSQCDRITNGPKQPLLSGFRLRPHRPRPESSVYQPNVFVYTRRWLGVQLPTLHFFKMNSPSERRESQNLILTSKSPKRVRLSGFWPSGKLQNSWSPATEWQTSDSAD